MGEKDYSLNALNQFLDYAADKGLLKRNTAMSRKIAANKILSVLDSSECSDLRIIDEEAAFERFTNLHRNSLKPESMRVYQVRLKSALADFIAYVDNPAAFKPSGIQRTLGRINKSEGGNVKQRSAKKSIGARDVKKEAETPFRERLFVIPVPLRDGLTVQIHNIPSDLSSLEAEKLAAIVRAYATPGE